MDRRLVALIVESHPEARTSLEGTVQERGTVDLLSCDGFLGATSWIHRCRCIDLMLCDVCLSESMTGVDLAEIAVKTHPQIAIVMTSVHARSGLSHLTERYGFLRKPFRPADMQRAIDRVFG